MNTATLGLLVLLTGLLVAVYGGWLEITGTQTGAVETGLLITIAGLLVYLNQIGRAHV